MACTSINTTAEYIKIKSPNMPSRINFTEITEMKTKDIRASAAIKDFRMNEYYF